MLNSVTQVVLSIVTQILFKDSRLQEVTFPIPEEMLSPF